MSFGHALNNGVEIPNIGRKCFHVNFYDFLYNDYFNIKYKPKTYLSQNYNSNRPFLEFLLKTHHRHASITQMDYKSGQLKPVLTMVISCTDFMGAVNYY